MTDQAGCLDRGCQEWKRRRKRANAMLLLRDRETLVKNGVERHFCFFACRYVSRDRLGAVGGWDLRSWKEEWFVECRGGWKSAFLEGDVLGDRDWDFLGCRW